MGHKEEGSFCLNLPTSALNYPQSSSLTQSQRVTHKMATLADLEVSILFSWKTKMSPSECEIRGRGVSCGFSKISKDHCLLHLRTSRPSKMDFSSKKSCRCLRKIFVKNDVFLSPPKSDLFPIVGALLVYLSDNLDN